MKKFVSILISIIFILSLAACSSNSSDKITETANGTTETTNKDIVDENLLNVDITVPASMFTEENPASAELTQEQKDKGFKSAVINEDGSVTYTMSKKAFKAYKSELLQSTQEQLNALPNDYTSIKTVEANDDLSQITLKVNKQEYENSMDYFCIYQAGVLCNICQAYTGETIQTVIDVVDQNSGETLNTATYPIDE